MSLREREPGPGPIPQWAIDKKRITALEAAMLRLLEAGSSARHIAAITHPDIAARWDNAARAAKELVK